MSEDQTTRWPRPELPINQDPEGNWGAETDTQNPALGWLRQARDREEIDKHVRRVLQGYEPPGDHDVPTVLQALTASSLHGSTRRGILQTEDGTLTGRKLRTAVEIAQAEPKAKTFYEAIAGGPETFESTAAVVEQAGEELGSSVVAHHPVSEILIACGDATASLLLGDAAAEGRLAASRPQLFADAVFSPITADELLDVLRDLLGEGRIDVIYSTARDCKVRLFVRNEERSMAVGLADGLARGLGHERDADGRGSGSDEGAGGPQ